MKINLLLIIFVMCSISIFGQTIKSYNLTFTGFYLPGGGGQSECYRMTNNSIKHNFSQITYNRNYHKKHKKKNLRKDIQIEITINQLDSLFRLNEYKFTVNQQIIDSLIAENSQNLYYQIPETYIENFFSHGDTIVIKANIIKEDEVEGFVIDGYAYNFNLEFCRNNEDTVKYSFAGNFYDNVQTYNIKYWLSIYLSYKQKTFCETMPMESYFSDENLIRILLRYIKWENE